MLLSGFVYFLVEKFCITYVINNNKKIAKRTYKEVAYFVINLHSRAQKKEIKDILCINNR